MGAIIMIVYEATKQLFVEDVVQDKIEENIDRTFYEKMGYHTSKSERDAWKNSMQYMLKVLIDNNIPANVGIAIEFKIPNFVSKSSNADSIMILELEHADISSDIDMRDNTSFVDSVISCLLLSFSNDVLIFVIAFLNAISDTSINVTIKPCIANNCAIPDPICPAPTTDTQFCIEFSLIYYYSN